MKQFQLIQTSKFLLQDKMQRNKKYYSNYHSSQDLNMVHNKSSITSDSHLTMPINKIQSNYKQQNYYRQQSNYNRSIIIPSSNQNNPFSPSNQYSYLNKYKKLDRFLDMENYFHNLYGHKKLQKQKLKAIQLQSKQKKDKQKLFLPSIYQRQFQQAQFQKQIFKLKMQNLQARLNKMQPLYMLDLNRLPPINSRCQCNCGMNSHNNQPMNNQGQNQVVPQNKGWNNFPQNNERRKKLLSKFRVYGIAIYFMTLFPHYSFLFGHFKLKQFLQKYLVQENKLIRAMNEGIIQKFKQIPIYEQIQMIHEDYEQEKKKLDLKAAQEQKNSSIRDKSKTKAKQQDPKIKISNQASNQNYIVNLGIFKRIIMMIIKLFDKLVQDLDQDTCQFLSIGTLNTSYYGDQILSIQQMPFIYCHQEKGNSQLNKQQQKALLLSTFIIKKLIYQYLVRLAVDQQWHQQLASYSTLKKKQITFFKLICKQLELSAFFLYQLSIKNFYTLIQSQKPGNFLQQPDDSLPLPLKTMRFPSLFFSGSQKQVFKYGFDKIINQKPNKQKSKPNQNKDNKKDNSKGRNSKDSKLSSNSKVDSRYDWNEQQNEIFEQYKLLIQQDPLNLIHNNFQFAQLSKIISQYMKSSYEKAQKSIMKIIQKLRVKLIQKRRKNYQRIRQKVLKKKYILTKEHEILQGIIFIRGNEDKKLVSIGKRMLQIYMQVLAENEIDNNSNYSQLTSKRQLIKKRNQQSKSNNKINQSMISIVSN